MGGANRCGTCGRTLETAGGECPACLLQLALGTSSEGDERAEPGQGRSKLTGGTRVGPYTIVRELGEGGMGVVYLSEQTEPLERRVALKVIKHGMDTEQVVKRFEAERQALARAYRDVGRLKEALVSARLATERATSLLTRDDPLIVASLTNLGAIERDNGEFEQARTTLDRALDLARKFSGEESADGGWVWFHLGWLEHQLGDDDAALAAYERGCAILESSLLPDDPGLASCFNDYSNVLVSLGRLDEARKTQERMLEIRRRVLPPDHPGLADAYTSIGSLFYRQKDYANAEESFLRGISLMEASRERTHGPEHPWTAGALRAWIARAEERDDEADAAMDAGYAPRAIDLTVDLASLADDPGLRRLLE